MTLTTAAVEARPAPQSSRWLRRALIGLVIGYVGFLIIAPMVALVVGALREGLRPIFEALSQPDVRVAFWRTIFIAAITVTVHSIFGMALAWVMVRHTFRGRRILNGLIDMPFALSAVVVGYMLLLLFGRGGLLAPLLTPLDIRIAFTINGMILATLFVTLPFMARELMPVLEAGGTFQERAAATLGASGWQTFWLVTFPTLRWGFIYGITLTFARALGEFGAVLIIGGGIQGRTETATLYIYRAIDERMYVGAYSAALILGLISVTLVIGTEMLRRRAER